MKRSKRFVSLLLIVLLLVCSMPAAVFASERVGIVDVDYTLNVRSGPGTGYSRTDSLNNGAVVSIQSDWYDNVGTLWYYITYTSSGTARDGYICAQYVIVTSVSQDNDFETYLTSQGFPESYKSGLRVLHALYPNWKFVAVHTNLQWSDVLAAETQVGRNLVQASSPSSWINTADVDSSGRQIARDGSNWVAASSAITAYSLDPRNFLSDPYILMFESLTYLPSLHTVDGIQNVLRGTFMSGSYYDESGNLATYADTFMQAAVQSNVSPYHLAARVRMEQGTGGTVLTSGTVSGYYGYYNFFNVGAYTTSTASSVVNGAQYAASGTTYQRPWTSPYKAIVGGSIYLGEGYINRGQDTMYTEKFNVTNRTSGLYYHQYMSSVTAPADESATLKKAYSTEVLQSALLFKIPVYLNMPDSPVTKPTGSSTGGSVTTPSTTVTPTPIVDTSTGAPSVTSAVYTFNTDGYVTGITEQTAVSALRSKLTYTSGASISITDQNGQPKDDGAIVCTGDQVKLSNSAGAAVSTYIMVIYGDVDGTGSITSLDLLRTQKYLLGSTSVTAAYQKALDVNHDGVINSLDLLRLQKHLLGAQAISQS